MNTSKLMEMYKSTFQPALEEGVYDTVMTKHEYVANDKGNPYIKFTFKVKNSGRILTDNRFEKGFGVLVSHIRQQLNKQNEAITPNVFFDELIKNETTIKIWVVKRTVDGIPRTNFHFLEPIKDTKNTATTKPEITVVDDTAEFENPTKA
jgi:hypothetical protein